MFDGALSCLTYSRQELFHHIDRAVVVEIDVAAFGEAHYALGLVGKRKQRSPKRTGTTRSHSPCSTRTGAVTRAMRRSEASDP